MNLKDILSNPGFHPVNEDTLNHLNYEELKTLYQTSSAWEFYMKNSCTKWNILQKIQMMRKKKKHLGQYHDKLFVGDEELIDPIGKVTGEVFVTTKKGTMNIHFAVLIRHYEKHGTVEDLKILLEFMVEFRKQKEIVETPSYLEEFIIDNNRPDFFNLLIPLKNNSLSMHEKVELCGFSQLCVGW